MKIISGPNDLMTSDEFSLNSNEDMRQKTTYSFTISIQAYGEEAMHLVTQIKFETQNPDNINFLREKAGISVTNRGGISDISFERETGFDRRYVLEFDFIAGFTIPINLGIIEKANVTQG